MVMVLLLPAVLAAQDRTGEAAADTARVHFTENADRYYIPAFPQFWIGLGAWFAAPDVTSVDGGYLPTERPSETALSPGFYVAARAQFSVHYSATVSMATHGDGSRGFQRYAVDACYHLPFSPSFPSNLFFGVGVARLQYNHDGASATGKRIRIEARRNAVHVLTGVNLIIPGGPGLTVAAGYEFAAAANGLDLSTPFLHASLMF